MAVPPVFEQYALPNSYFVDIASPERRRDYRLFIGGHQRERRDVNPRDVVFVVDGNWLFPLVAEHIRLLSLFTPVGLDPVVIGVNTQRSTCWLNPNIARLNPSQGSPSALTAVPAVAVPPLI